MQKSSPIDHLVPTSGPLRFDRLAKALETVSERQCRRCGELFQGIGFSSFCDPCDEIVTAERSKPQAIALDSSWPRLQAGKLEAMTGPGLALAEKLAPKLMSPRTVVLAGDRGRGKTQIATHCAAWRGKLGREPGIYTRAFDMAESIVGFDRETKLERFQRAAFLVVDECHRLEARHLAALESIVDARYSNRRTTILIGNWMTEDGVQDGETVNGQKLNGIGPTLMDRVNETGGVVWCRWESYRAGGVA